MERFQRMKRLPPYVFSITESLKEAAIERGEDVIDFSMGNPDRPTPKHIVNTLIETAKDPTAHRYSISRGCHELRKAICDWYKRRYNVDLNPETEAIATIGVKEGMSHLALAVIGPGDVAITLAPTYPIHAYCVIISNGDLRQIPLNSGEETFFEKIEKTIKETWPRPKLLILNFPHNPTTTVVDEKFFENIVVLAKDHKLFVIHDLAYADLVFDGYKAPSFLQIKGAKDVGVEFFSVSKSYNMAGWRVGFCVGNKTMVSALTRIKSYLDYGIFIPIQRAAITALSGPQDCVKEIAETYRKRRDVLVGGLNKIDWHVEKPKATMFLWAKIPEQYKYMGSLEFSKFLLNETKVAVSPGIGFGPYGDDHVRFSFIEDLERTEEAVWRLQKVL